MNSPDNRISWILSVGGKNIRIGADRDAADIILMLRKLFTDFNIPDLQVHIDAEFIVRYAPSFNGYQTLSKKPTNLRKTQLFTELQRQMQLEVFSDGINGADDHDLAVGFCNGMMIYNDRSKRAICILWQGGQEENFLVGSLHKLLFIFLCLFMAAREYFFVHSAAVQYEGRGYIFWGPSGAGKTTIAGFAEKHNVYSDDAPIIFRKQDAFFCSVSPYRQLDKPTGQSTRRTIPIHKNIFLHKANDLRIIDRSSSQALAEIIPSHFHNYEFMSLDMKRKAFDFSYDLCRTVPSYDLYFTKDNRFWDLIVKMTD